MLQATFMGGLGADGAGSHVHAQSLRPDRVIKTGVIEPYPIQQWDPMQIAQQILAPFITDNSAAQGPGVSSDPSPEEIVDQARNYATAVRQGLRLPNWLSRQALAAINALLKGVAFTVTAQGRTLLVKPTTSVTNAQVAAQQQMSGLGGIGIDGPGGSTLPSVPTQTIQQAAMSRLGPATPFLQQATRPAFRQARDQQSYYLDVRNT